MKSASPLRSALSRVASSMMIRNVSVSRYGGVLWETRSDVFTYLSFRTSVTWSPRTHSWSRYGPVPTGFDPKSAPYFFTAVGDTTPRTTSCRLLKNGAYGSLKVILIVLESRTWLDW